MKSKISINPLTQLLSKMFRRSKKSIFPLGTNDWESYALFQAGVEYQLKGDKKQARQMFSEAHQKDPGNRGAIINLGILDLEAGNYIRAQKRLEEARDNSDKGYDTDWFTAIYQLVRLHRHRALEKLDHSTPSEKSNREKWESIKQKRAKVLKQVQDEATNGREKGKKLLKRSSKFRDDLIKALHLYQMAIKYCKQLHDAKFEDADLIPHEVADSSIETIANLNKTANKIIDYVSKRDPRSPDHSPDVGSGGATDDTLWDADEVVRKAGEGLLEIGHLSKAVQYAKELYYANQNQLRQARWLEFFRINRGGKKLSYLKSINPSATIAYSTLLCETKAVGEANRIIDLLREELEDPLQRQKISAQDLYDIAEFYATYGEKLSIKQEEIDKNVISYLEDSLDRNQDFAQKVLSEPLFEAIQSSISLYLPPSPSLGEEQKEPIDEILDLREEMVVNLQDDSLNRTDTVVNTEQEVLTQKVDKVLLLLEEKNSKLEAEVNKNKELAVIRKELAELKTGINTQLESLKQQLDKASSLSLEEQLASLESGSDVDEELEAMKAQLGGFPPKSTLSSPLSSEVDPELEDLKRELDNL
jgi:tetratricopeptide (TPR) repeat protein